MKTFRSSKTLLHYGILFGVFIIAYVFIFDSKIFHGSDNANYYILAKGLSEGAGFTNFNLPVVTPANHFPPGYPFLMSIVMRLGIDSIFAMKVLNGIFLFLSSVLMYHITVRIFKNHYFALVLGVLLLMNNHLLQFSTIMMSEMPFLTFFLLFVLLFIINHEKGFNYKSPYLYAMIAALIVCIYIRSQGFAFLGALLLVLVFQKKYKALIISFLICFITILPWQLRSSQLGGNSYMIQIVRIDPTNPNSPELLTGDWLERISDNFTRYVSKEIPSAVVPGIKVNYDVLGNGERSPAPFFHWILGVLVITLTLFGIWSLKLYRWFFLLLFGSSFSILLLWPPGWYGVRFFLPLIPFTVLFCLYGIYKLIEYFSKTEPTLKESNKLAVKSIAVCFFQISPMIALHNSAKVPYPTNWTNYFAVGEWTVINLPENAVISTRKPALFYLYSKHKTIRFGYSADKNEALKWLDDHKITHVVVDQLGFKQTTFFLLPLVQSEIDKFKMIYDVDGYKTTTNEAGELIADPSAAWIFEYNKDLGFQGIYKDGMKDGKGSYNYPDGSIIEGTWLNDTLQGPGQETLKDGRTYIGNWVDGKKDGTFTIFTETGGIIESFWTNDSLQETGYLLDAEKNRIKEIELN